MADCKADTLAFKSLLLSIILPSSCLNFCSSCLLWDWVALIMSISLFSFSSRRPAWLSTFVSRHFTRSSICEGPGWRSMSPQSNSRNLRLGGGERQAGQTATESLLKRSKHYWPVESQSAYFHTAASCQNSRENCHTYCVLHCKRPHTMSYEHKTAHRREALLTVQATRKTLLWPCHCTFHLWTLHCHKLCVLFWSLFAKQLLTNRVKLAHRTTVGLDADCHVDLHFCYD